MREFLQRHKAAIAAFFALTIPLFLLFVHGRHPRKTTVIEAALMQITAPVQRAAGRVLDGLGELWSGYVALVDLQDDNEQLRQQVALLKQRADRVSEIELENAELRRMLDFKKARRELVTAGAHVIGKDVSPYARVLRLAIDVGQGAALREGMPVVNADGLVGRIHRVSSGYAEVLLTVDARSQVNVKVFGKSVTGTVTGTSSQRNYVARMTYLHKAEPLAVGDLLVTSGHDKVFPPGLKVGYIRDLDERQRDFEYELQVTPAVNFSDVSVVHVITDVLDQAAAAGAGRVTP
ncbi:MAG: rod shape-determining protein MreC [Proteobacteria bacterium]|nr:MAG: rod shape-determining protein MreC [Pseudomonadota bacterium]